MYTSTTIAFSYSAPLHKVLKLVTILLCILLRKYQEIQILANLKGQSHEKGGEVRVWGVRLGHN
jgi:hypothetical protein